MLFPHPYTIVCKLLHEIISQNLGGKLLNENILTMSSKMRLNAIPT